MRHANPTRDAGAEFRAAIRAAGLEPPDLIEPGNLHRFPSNGKRGDDAGWCKLFADLRGGVFGDFRSGLSETWQAQRAAAVLRNPTATASRIKTLIVGAACRGLLPVRLAGWIIRRLHLEAA